MVSRITCQVLTESAKHNDPDGHRGKRTWAEIEIDHVKLLGIHGGSPTSVLRAAEGEENTEDDVKSTDPDIDETKNADLKNEEKTSAIHFMRFELTAPMVIAAKTGECIAAGIDHPAYTVLVDEIAPQTQASLIEDLS